MKKSCFKIILLLLLSVTCGFAQNIAGYWQGYIHITPKDSLAVGMFVTQTDDTMTLVMDSPDQYSMDIPVSSYKWADSTLSFKVASAGASFTGKLSADGQKITGTLKQSGKLPLTLERGHQRKVINRPQTPKPPYPYTEEEVRIMSKNGKYSLINGTLTMPAGSPKALVVLLTGSGWQDRNEEIFGHKPFLVIADHLTRAGYAVFRYDDFPRAVFATSTTFDFADGVTMILDSFARRKDLDTLPVGLIGHSEGSMVAEIVAARDKRVDFIVTIGGVAQKMSDVLLYQIRALNEADSSMTSEEIEHAVALSGKIYHAIEKSKTPEKAANEIREVFKTERLNTRNERMLEELSYEKMISTARSLCSPWFFKLFHFDPKGCIKKIKCPVLTLGGEKDLQVDAVTNNALFESYLPKNQYHQFSVVPNANHLLQTCEKGSLDEYGKIEETIQPDVLKQMTEWMGKVISEK